MALMREEKLKILQDEKKRLEEEMKTLKTECFKLSSVFCTQKEGHTYTVRTVRINSKPLYHSFSKGRVYPTQAYNTCLVCGSSNDPKRALSQRGGNQSCCLEGCEDVIKKASKQTENLELQKTALRILEILKQIERLSGKINKNSKGFEELCSIYGHDVKLTSLGDYSICRCCGKKCGFTDVYFVSENI